MGRRIRTLVPQTDNFLIPTWPYWRSFVRKTRQGNKICETISTSVTKSNLVLRFWRKHPYGFPAERRLVSGTVVTQANCPRSYVVDTPSGRIERNRHHLRVQPEQDTPAQETETSLHNSPVSWGINRDNRESTVEEEIPQSSTTSRRIQTRSQTGTNIQPPPPPPPRLLSLGS